MKCNRLLCGFFVVTTIMFSLFFCSCHHSKNDIPKNVDSFDSILQRELLTLIADTKLPPVDIPISIRVEKDILEDDMMWYVSKKEGFKHMTFKIKNEIEDTLFIDATSWYYDQYVSGHRFKVGQAVKSDFEKYRGLLNLEMDVVNNSENKLDIEELELCVEKSEPDTLPFIYIYTAYDISNTISFNNESWFDWSGFTFSYSILKDNEEFDNVYRQKKYLKYFETDTTINLLPNLLELGYDFKKICRECDKQHSAKFDYKSYQNLCDDKVNFKSQNTETERYDCICLQYDAEDYRRKKDKLIQLFSPFSVVEHFSSYEGRAKLFGKIEFDNTDFKIEFEADIVLSTDCGFGAGGWENDRFDVELRTSDTNYTLRYPYTTVIEPYGAEMVKLRVNAKKSSNHLFYISLKNGNDLNIRSKNVKLHYLSPPNYYYINN